MELLGIIDEDFVNYKLPSMTLIFPRCNMKCNIDAGRVVCHNNELQGGRRVDIPVISMCERYLNNPISKAIVCQGLEPFDSFSDLSRLVHTLREDFECKDPVVIYTGYTEEELSYEVQRLKKFENIIIKFGRFVPDTEPHFDKVLGVELASPNQYAKEFK